MTEIRSAHEALGKLIEQNTEEESEEVKKADIEKMLTEGIAKALEPFAIKLDAVEKSVVPETTPAAQEQPEVTAEDVAKMVAEAVTKAVEPLAQRIEKVETARGVAKQLENDGQQPTLVAKGYMEYLK